ncbi:MAG: hypothetical protein U0325_03060 [Polyangiales bacterium]
MVSAVPLEVARRELAVVKAELGFDDAELVTTERTAPCPGNALALTFAHERVTEVFVGLGARGVSAEQVARRACGEARRWLRSDAPVGPHLADQLIAPLALAGGGVFPHRRADGAHAHAARAGAALSRRAH